MKFRASFIKQFIHNDSLILYMQHFQNSLSLALRYHMHIIEINYFIWFFAHKSRATLASPKVIFLSHYTLAAISRQTQMQCNIAENFTRTPLSPTYNIYIIFRIREHFLVRAVQLFDSRESHAVASAS